MCEKITNVLMENVGEMKQNVNGLWYCTGIKFTFCCKEDLKNKLDEYIRIITDKEKQLNEVVGDKNQKKLKS